MRRDIERANSWLTPYPWESVPAAESAVSESALSVQERRSAARWAARALRVSTSRNGVGASGAAILLLALCPESLGSVRRIIGEGAGRAGHEARFVLAVEAGLAVRNGWKSTYSREIMDAFARRLAVARVDREFSTSILGCVLGDDWDAAESLPVLQRLALSASFSAGRKAALHGLAHLYGRGAREFECLRAIEKARAGDHRRSVRVHAEWLITELLPTLRDGRRSICGGEQRS